VDRDDWEQFREVMSEVMRRSDLRWTQWLERWDKRDERRHNEVMAKLEEQRAKTDRLLADSEANTAALWALVDRLNGGGGAEPAT
jgi:hypothetical protein